MSRKRILKSEACSLINSKVRNVAHSGRVTFRVWANYNPHLGELQSAVMAANSNVRSPAGAADAVTGLAPSDSDLVPKCGPGSDMACVQLSARAKTCPKDLRSPES